MSLVEQTRQLLAEERYRIALHDLVGAETKRAASLTTREQFPVQGQWSNGEFIERVKRYETAVFGLSSIQALLAYWGGPLHARTLTLPAKRMCDELGPEGGLVVWTALRWYPVLLLLYAGGVAAVGGARYENLGLLFDTPVSDPDHSGGRVALVRAVVRGLREAWGVFKSLPGFEDRRTPMNDHLLKLLEPVLSSAFFLGGDYEAAFDEFEVLMSLEHANQDAGETPGRVWGPIGRFGWKIGGGDASSPFHRVVADAQRQGATWPPIRAGMFKGSVERFNEVTNEFGKTVSRLGW